MKIRRQSDSLGYSDEPEPPKETVVLQDQHNNVKRSNARHISALLEVINKIRKRLFAFFVVFALFSGLGYYLADAVMRNLFAMVRQVVFISPTEAFVTKVKIALALGLVMALPILLYVIIGFARGRVNGLTKTGQLLFAGGSFFLFLCGSSLCYFLALPLALDFLQGFSTMQMQPLFSAGRLVSFAVMTVLAFGLSFELPLIILVLARVGILNDETLRKKRRHAFLGSFIVGAILTPSPDVLSQTLMAIPLFGLYELGIWLTRCFGKKQETAEPSVPPDQQQSYP